MNGRRRVVVVARHYWPTTTDQSLRLRAWTRKLRQDGYQPLVLTPRWNSGWPRSFMCEEIQVQLLDMPHSTQLLSKRYSRILVDRVHAEIGNVEAIYCDAADVDAQALLKHLPKHGRPPIIVRFDSPNLSSSGSYSTLRRVHQMVDICRLANTVIVSNVVAHQQLVAQGIHERLIQRWPDDAVMRVDRSAAGQRMARHMLGHTQHDLFVRGQDRLIVCPGELNEEWEISMVIKALGPLVEQFRPLKLWLVGGGKEAGNFYEQLRHQGWHRIVVMPGCFTDLEHVLQAADLCLFPSPELGWQWLIPTCVANSLPFLVADGQIARQMLGAACEQLCFRAHDADDLQQKVNGWYRRSLAAFDGPLATAREQMARQFSRSGPTTSLAQLLGSRLSLPS